MQARRVPDREPSCCEQLLDYIGCEGGNRAIQLSGFSVDANLKFRLDRDQHAVVELGFTPSAPPTALASESTYDQDEDDLTQVAFAVKAYITQNGSDVDAMRGGVGEAVDNAVTRTGRFMGGRSDGRRSNTESGDVLSVIESWVLWCETYGSFTRDDVQDSIRHAVGFLVLDDWRQGVRKFQEQFRQAHALKIELNYNQTVFRYLYELRRERDAVTTRLEVEWGKLPKGMTHSQNFISHTAQPIRWRLPAHHARRIRCGAQAE